MSHVLTSDTIFEITDLPRSVAVIGLGVIAMELGQALHRLGVETTFYGRSGSIGCLTHPDMTEETLQIFSNELEIYPSGLIESTWETEEGAWIQYRPSTGDTVTKVFDPVLVATGRVSNIDRLNLEAAGIERGPDGDITFNQETLSYPGHPIFIAGDAADVLPVWHEAFDEGRFAAENALCYPNTIDIKLRTPLVIYFTDPQQSIVGKTFKELQDQEIVIGRLAFDSLRHIVWSTVEGRIQVYLDAATGVFLGAELLGHQAEHLAHILALAITHSLTAAQVLEMPIYHPSAEELLRDVLINALTKRYRRMLVQVASISQSDQATERLKQL